MKNKKIISRTIINVFLLLYSIIVLFPIIWAIYSSFKTNREFYKNPWSLPGTLYFENYATAWTKAHIDKYFFNSVIITITVVIMLAVLASMTAYVLSRYNFKIGNFITTLYMGGLFVPTILGVIPTFLVLMRLNLVDNLGGLGLVYIAYGLPFTVFVMAGFFKTLPHEMEEAALIDGSSLNKTFWRIMFPLARSGVITVCIFNFLAFWNEYILALTYITSDKNKTLSLGLINLMEVTQFETNWGALFAGLIIVMLPTIVVYAIFQSKITSGLNMGAIKG